MPKISRRDFLMASAVATVGATSYPLLRQLQAVQSVNNPLEAYPFRDWEQVYRDQYAYDDRRPESTSIPRPHWTGIRSPRSRVIVTRSPGRRSLTRGGRRCGCGPSSGSRVTFELTGLTRARTPLRCDRRGLLGPQRGEHLCRYAQPAPGGHSLVQ